MYHDVGSQGPHSPKFYISLFPQMFIQYNKIRGYDTKFFNKHFVERH